MSRKAAGQLDDRLQHLNQLADEVGWLEAVQRTFADEPELVNYVTNERRLKLLEIIPIEGADVLEIGPGMGQFTVAIAQKAKSVKAIEVSPGQAEFVEKRSRQQGLENVEVAAGGADCLLPYPDGSFDTVVMNLVLEWCAERSGADDPAVAQNRILREIHRVLRPSGCAFVSTKNRYALRYLLGKGDEHLHGLPFGSALPRVAQKIALQVAGKGPARGKLHSIAELGRMLTAAGFSRADWYIAAPEFRFPVALVPANGKSVAEARKSGVPFGDSRSTRLLMSALPSSAIKYVSHGLTVLAFKAV